MRVTLVALLLLLVPVRAAALEWVAVETPFASTESTVLVRDLETGRERPVARVSHVPGYGVEGSLSPDGRWLAFSVLSRGKQPWRNGSVFLVDLDSASAEPRLILDGAVLARPVWTGPKSLLTVRATAEHEPEASEARAGRLLDFDYEVLALDVAGGQPSVLLRDRCQGLEPVAVLGAGAIAVVRRSWEGSSLLLVAVDGTVRRPIPLGPAPVAWLHTTPDLSAIVFQQVSGPDTWSIGRADANGRSDLLRVNHPHAAPIPVAKGVAFSSYDGRSIDLLDERRTIRTLWRDPSAARLVPRISSPDGRFLVVERLERGPAQAFVVDLASGRRLETPVTRGAWRETMGLRGAP